MFILSSMSTGQGGGGGGVSSTLEGVYGFMG